MAIATKAIKGWSTSTKVAVGVGSLVAVAAAVYLLTGKRGERNRAKIRHWTSAMKREIVTRLHSLRSANRRAYERVVSQVARRYRGMKHVDPRELDRTVRQINRLWKSIGTKTETLKASGRKRQLRAA